METITCLSYKNVEHYKYHLTHSRAEVNFNKHFFLLLQIPSAYTFWEEEIFKHFFYIPVCFIFIYYYTINFFHCNYFILRCNIIDSLEHETNIPM